MNNHNHPFWHHTQWRSGTQPALVDRERGTLRRKVVDVHYGVR